MSANIQDKSTGTYNLIDHFTSRGLLQAKGSTSVAVIAGCFTTGVSLTAFT